MKIGIMGGTFDPIHMGHLIAAEEARWQLKLEQVLFIPAGQPWLKTGRPYASAQDRREMVKLAIQDHPGFKLSMVEMDRTGPSYTADTIGILREEFGSAESMFFILGCDSLAELPQWKDPEQIIAGCNLVAVPRTDCPPPDMASLEVKVPGLSRHTIQLDMPLIGISSTDIRHRVAMGQSIKYLVTGAVERYIRENRLYLS